MRKLWGIFCIFVLCVVFSKLAALPKNDADDSIYDISSGKFDIYEKTEYEENITDQNENRQKSQDIPSDDENEIDTNLMIGVGEKKKIAITFDDGPHPTYTKRLLDGLKARRITANFFVLGENAEKYPDLIKQMEEDGHLIGNHTYHHVQLNAVSEQQACQEILAANQTLKEITGEEPMYLRPPFGAWSRKADSPADMISVYWDIDPLDWKTTDAQLVSKRILDEVEEGDIILLHDVYASSVEAAFIVIDELERQGYEFVTVEELFFD